jgi:hypothetical protein
MSNNIPVITQEKFEPTAVLPNPKLTMALPSFLKMLQMTIWGRVAKPTSPEP